MKILTCRIAFLVLLTIAFSTPPSVEAAGQIPVSTQKTTDPQVPNLGKGNPKAEDATSVILAAFRKYQVVGMNASHGNKDLDDFILHILRNPDLPGTINDIAVECGNSFYQSILDRYIAGGEMSISEARQVWRNTTQLMCGISSFYEELFPLVRRINQRLPPEKRLRVLACDPPIEWNRVKVRGDLVVMDRDASIASVMEKEVLSKHRKALMLFGTVHLYHRGSMVVGFHTAVELYEKDYPGVTFVIGDHVGFFNWSPRAKFNDQLEAQIASWPIPSVVQQVKGSWLEDIDPHYFADDVDAYLYLGPRDLLLHEPSPAAALLDKDYMAELQRRAAISDDRVIMDIVNPETVLERDSNPFFYDPDELSNIFQSLNMPTSSSEVPASVNRSSMSPSCDPQLITGRDVPQAIHLPIALLRTFAGRYAPDSTLGTNIAPIQIVAEHEGLSVDLGLRGEHKFVPVSSAEFMEDDAPGTRITFTRDEKGQIAGLIFTGLWAIGANKLP
jgi:hypothetical protein